MADRGIKVAFHFHPMVYYQGWRNDYERLAEEVAALFPDARVKVLSSDLFGSARALKAEIAPRIAAYESPREFYVAKLAEGVSTLTAASCGSFQWLPARTSLMAASCAASHAFWPGVSSASSTTRAAPPASRQPM